MAKLEVLDWKKKKSGEVEVPDQLVNDEVRKDILHTLVRWQLASRRAGTHNTKSRGEVSGSSKKPYKQKGTGQARQGNLRSHLLRGGAVAHGPHPRDYSFSVNKKTRQKGLRSALSYLYKEGRLFVVDDMTSADGKTKEMASRLKDFGLSKALLIDSGKDEKFARATNNLSTFRYNTVSGLNVYDVLKYDNLVISKSSLEEISKKCGVQ
ncbi:MAG: 50S ribosomal protein L4 [Chlamydiia bacterium]|nr:50S ribosomal protein L4 [Bdellovibrionales bacterium]MCB1115113.1 50S ribosomal protein L4 [Chlamydiia bacterium]